MSSYFADCEDSDNQRQENRRHRWKWCQRCDRWKHLTEETHFQHKTLKTKRCLKRKHSTSPPQRYTKMARHDNFLNADEYYRPRRVINESSFEDPRLSRKQSVLYFSGTNCYQGRCRRNEIISVDDSSTKRRMPCENNLILHHRNYCSQQNQICKHGPQMNQSCQANMMQENLVKCQKYGRGGVGESSSSNTGRRYENSTAKATTSFISQSGSNDTQNRAPTPNATDADIVDSSSWKFWRMLAQTITPKTTVDSPDGSLDTQTRTPGANVESLDGSLDVQARTAGANSAPETNISDKTLCSGQKEDDTSSTDADSRDKVKQWLHENKEWIQKERRKDGNSLDNDDKRKKKHQ
ncbi:hypothetical protein WDU94_013535 [Cyamophila willieti]